jgi:prepilin-type N-terminal cleavage/methylation domain-containing protein
MNPVSRTHRAFSLVEVLAAVGIIGIIAFLAVPNIVSYIQANGRDNVAAAWSSADNQGRYANLIPYLSFAPATIAEYTPNGYTITLPGNLNALTKSVLADTSSGSPQTVAY